ncbi:MAG: peptidoglycan DD-metalloendopeptidase family protein [Rhodocyclaceae bacterium]|nr:peptidoglycan DD-metalloendopeptidase family protein [Rhodocyclaceae bacterium]
MAALVSLRAAAWFLIGGVCAAGLPARASPAAPAELGAHQADLEEIKNRLKALQKDIASTEESRSAASQSLAAAEQAYSDAARRLQSAVSERRRLEGELAGLEAERQSLERRIEGRHGELAAWLRRYYTHARGEGVAHMLDAGDLNQLARNAYYMERIAHANRALLDSLRADLGEKVQLGEEIGRRRQALLVLEADERGRGEELARLQQHRKKAVAELSAKLGQQRREIDDLKEDEQRLGRLIAGLKRIARERAAAAAAAEAEARRKAIAEHSEGAAAKPAVASRKEVVVGRSSQVAGPTPMGVSFAQLQGRLAAPVRGELIGRFGTPRAGGGPSWKGVFFRTASGAEIHAVAAGEVVFSDWLRGFGNLIIVDHGGEYLSIYGNNDALLKTAGQRVSGGEVVASAGASGGGAETGLYFEIRREGQAVDPLKWIRLQ